MKAVKATFANGKITFAETPPQQGPVEVLVVFPEANSSVNVKSREHAEQARPEFTIERLPADVKAAIIAGMPPAEEQVRLYRETQEDGGLSSEQFLASLGLDVEPPS